MIATWADIPNAELRATTRARDCTELSRKKGADPAAAEATLGLVLPPEKMYEPRELISPTQAEALLKKKYASVAGFVTQSDPQLRLVPLDHKGEAVSIQPFGLVKSEESLV